MARDAAAGAQTGSSRVAAPQVAVGAVCVVDGRLLVIERANDPGAGRWSLPGGRVEPGETLADALRCEVAEEAALDVAVGALCGIAERIGDGYHYVILDFWVAPTAAGAADAPAASTAPSAPTPAGPHTEVSLTAGTEPPAVSPGDDSSDARWVTRDKLLALPLVAGLEEWLDEHGVLSQLD